MLDQKGLEGDKRSKSLQQIIEGKGALPSPVAEVIKQVSSTDEQELARQVQEQVRGYNNQAVVEALRSLGSLVRYSVEVGGLPLSDKLLEWIADAVQNGNEEALVALKLMGARILESVWGSEPVPRQEAGQRWQALTSEQRLAVRIADALILTAETHAVQMRLQGKSKKPITHQQAVGLARQFQQYAKNEDVPPDFAKMQRNTARELKEHEEELPGFEKPALPLAGGVTDIQAREHQTIYVGKGPQRSRQEVPTAVALESSVLDESPAGQGSVDTVKAAGMSETKPVTAHELQEQHRDSFFHSSWQAVTQAPDAQQRAWENSLLAAEAETREDLRRVFPELFFGGQLFWSETVNQVLVQGLKKHGFFQGLPHGAKVQEYLSHVLDDEMTLEGAQQGWPPAFVRDELVGHGQGIRYKLGPAGRLFSGLARGLHKAGFIKTANWVQKSGDPRPNINSLFLKRRFNVAVALWRFAEHVKTEDPKLSALARYVAVRLAQHTLVAMRTLSDERGRLNLG